MSTFPKSNQVKGAYLITGSAGIGKSTLARILSAQGYHAVDGDKAYGTWVTKEGNPVAWRNRDTGGQAWMDNHRWIFDPVALTSAITKHSNDHLFICGITRNQQDFYHLFNRIFFLHAEIEVIIGRLNDPNRDHHFGKEPHQQQRIREGFANFVQEYVNNGAVFINATQTPAEIAHDILQQVDTA